MGSKLNSNEIIAQGNYKLIEEMTKETLAIIQSLKK